MVSTVTLLYFCSAHIPHLCCFTCQVRCNYDPVQIIYIKRQRRRTCLRLSCLQTDWYSRRLRLHNKLNSLNYRSCNIFTLARNDWCDLLWCLIASLCTDIIQIERFSPLQISHYIPVIKDRLWRHPYRGSHYHVSSSGALYPSTNSTK